MNKIEQLRRHGLFEAKVPRYTSYPPANHFSPVQGELSQAVWLAEVPPAAALSLYLHIPFCRRLCWFCACRTQGTRSLRPVEDYVETLIAEVALVRRRLPAGIVLARLHLGGGTPTILGAGTMGRLLSAVFEAFGGPPTEEFSVEIDPTEAAPELLQALARHGLTRASIGVQDFDPRVQQAIGRAQSFAQTTEVVQQLRSAGVSSLNMDLLYGLPFQTRRSLSETLGQVMALQPDRLALYGYAHVPKVSRRQVMIDENTLPDPERRYDLAELARHILVNDGYVGIGIDHFALPHDSLARAAQERRLRRNFQGYTDDSTGVLIGLGASSISRFPQGYVQNVAATRDYLERVRQGSLAGQRGYAMTAQDRLRAQMIEDLMCCFALDAPALRAAFPEQAPDVDAAIEGLVLTFPDVLHQEGERLHLRPGAHPLVRIVAQRIDTFVAAKDAHSASV